METNMPIVEGQGTCAEPNPLGDATCRLPFGHDGPHWGHGPTWTWNEVMCETVPPSEAPPQGYER